MGHGEDEDRLAAGGTARPPNRGTRPSRIEGKPGAPGSRSGAAQIRRARAALLRGTRPEPLMPHIAALYLAGREWLWPAVTAGSLVLCAVAWSYVRTPAPHLV